MTSDVKQLVKAGMRHPVMVTIREPGQASGTIALPSTLRSYYLVSGVVIIIIEPHNYGASMCIGV